MNYRNCTYSKRNFLLLILFLLLQSLPRLTAQNELRRMGFEKVDTLGSLPSCIVGPSAHDTVFTREVATINKKTNSTIINIYEMPYSKTDNYPNYKRLALNTGILYGAGILTLGILQLLPEDATSWNKQEITSKPFFKRWGDNVRKGPVWDNDNIVFNYILHPYGGAAYYMSARSQGFNMVNSFLYCTGVSTIFWEYGIEAFMEVPSIQDLILTPTIGLLLGEGFYKLKRQIVSNEYRLMGSRFLGSMVAYLIDPVNEVIGIFAGNPNRAKIKNSKTRSSVACTPVFLPLHRNRKMEFSMNIAF